MESNSIGEVRFEPRATRLRMPKFYEAAGEGEGLLPWSHVVERLDGAQNYWLATTWPDGRPHVAPIWGAWVDDALYFDGIYTARWARNMAANPAITIHLESGTDVVILEGKGEEMIPEPVVAARIVEVWTAKYATLIPDAAKGMYRLRPRMVRAWSRFPHDATRWRFNDE